MLQKQILLLGNKKMFLPEVKTEIIRRWHTRKSVFWIITRASGNYQVTIYEGTTPGKKKKSGRPTSNCLPLLLEVVQDAEVSYYCLEGHRGL